MGKLHRACGWKGKKHAWGRGTEKKGENNDNLWKLGKRKRTLRRRKGEIRKGTKNRKMCEIPA